MKEGEIFSKYLFGIVPSHDVLERYRKFVSDRPSSPLLQFAVKNPWLICFLDPATGFFRRRSELRKRLHIMFMVMECTPETAAMTFPAKNSPGSLFIAACSAASSCLLAFIGWFILIFIPES